VAKILIVPLDDLMSAGTLTRTTREREGRRIDVPAFRAGGEEIWGATAMVLAEFLSILGWRPR
jgi:hypothetical protein